MGAGRLPGGSRYRTNRLGPAGQKDGLKDRAAFATGDS